MGKRLVAVAALLALAPSSLALAARRPASRKARPRAATVPALPSMILPAEASSHDLAVGEASRRALGRQNGAVVAMDPRTGRVLALVNPGHGLVKAYQPCSVFKVVVGLAGLSEGVITPDSRLTCAGGTCWNWPGHGPIDLRRALAGSCNPFFEQVGERLGYTKVQEYARLLGLGAPSGINLTGEAAGKLPEFVRPEDVGHLSSHAAGIATSGVQLAVLISAMINGGIVYQPQVTGGGSFVPRERWRLPPSARVQGLAEGFVGAVNEGSASSAFDPDIAVAGKTGSCSGLGWFASYAPADRPEVVIVTMVRPGTGHSASAVGARIYQRLYKPAPLPIVSAGGG